MFPHPINLVPIIMSCRLVVLSPLVNSVYPSNPQHATIPPSQTHSPPPPLFPSLQLQSPTPRHPSSSTTSTPIPIHTAPHITAPTATPTPTPRSIRITLPTTTIHIPPHTVTSFIQINPSSLSIHPPNPMDLVTLELRPRLNPRGTFRG